MDLKIETSSTTVLSSGIVVMYNQEPLIFKLENLTFLFKLENDITDLSSRIFWEATGKNELTCKLINFNNPLGSGTPNPLNVGTLKGKHIFVNFRLYGVQNSDPTFHYTFYLGKEDVKK